MDAQTIMMICIAALSLSVCHAPAVLAGSSGQNEKIAVARANNAFAADVYRQLKPTPDNLVFSPYSLFTALSMTYAGAKQSTETQMAEVLHFPFEAPQIHEALNAWGQTLQTSDEDAQKGYQLYHANALWTQEGQQLLTEFTDLLRTYYNATLTTLDFKNTPQQAADAINAWVNQHTQGKISELLHPQNISQNILLILTNAIYFKGAWQFPFDKEKTQEAAFTLIDGKQVNVPMMQQTASVLYGEDHLVQVLELPYVHPESATPLAMRILLPKDPTTFPECEAALSAEYIESLFAPLQPRKVAISLPRFHVQGTFSLPEALRALGMTDAFSLPPADFSGITHSQNLYISEVLHKVILEVNEEGAEAAGASAVIMARGLSQPLVFQVDHPFWIMICDNTTGGILFWGRIMDPRG